MIPMADSIVDVSWSSVLVLCTVLFISFNLMYPFWRILYIRCLVILMYKWRKRRPTLLDSPLDDKSLGNKQADVYDEISFMCVNGADNSYLHVEITRKSQRKSYVKFTLCMKGYTYSLPSEVVTYNNSRSSFSSSGLTLTLLQEGSRWRLSYSGPMIVSGDESTHRAAKDNEEIKQVKILLLWKHLSINMDSFTNEYTKRSLASYFSQMYADGRISAGEILDLATQPQQTSDRTVVQSGLMHGFIQLHGEDEQNIVLRGFKRRSAGEIKEIDGSASFIEQILVSKKGNFHYIRIPKCSPMVLTSAELSKLCSVRMYPNGELAEADLQLIYPYVGGWSRADSISTRDSRGTHTTTKAMSGVDTVHSYELKDSQRRARSCLLMPITLQHKHPGLSSTDEGLGLIVYTNVGVQAASKDKVVVDPILVKEVVPYQPTQSLPLLCTQSADICDVATSDKLIIGLDHPDCKNDRLVGGKGSQLAVLYQSDIQEQCCVPMAACLTVKAFQLQLESCPQLVELSSQLDQITEADNSKIHEVCDKIRGEFMSSEMCPKISTALQLHLQHIENFNEDSRLAVRSSAIGEDGEELSAAGQMETILGVRGFTDIVKAVKQCWASHFTFLAVQYKRQHGQLLNSGMGVVIQEMVRAELAGALFTNDPVTASSATMVINANFGIGESVVSGQTEPDTYRVNYRYDQTGAAIFSIDEKHLGSKQIQYVVTESGDVSKQSTNRSSVFCVDEETVICLCQIGLDIEKRFGHPCDIEWAISQGQIYLLQSRPITTLILQSDYELLHEFDSALVMDDEMLSTMNVGEALPGALCPLTLSVVAPMLENAVTELLSAIGLTVTAGVMRSVKSCYNTLLISVHTFEVGYSGRTCVASRRMTELALAGHTLDAMTDEVVLSFHPPLSLWARVYNSLKFCCTLWGAVSRCSAHDSTIDKLALPDTDDCMQVISFIDQAAEVSRQVFMDNLPAAAVSSVYSQVIMGMLTKGAQVWEMKHYGDLAVLLGCHLNEVFSAGVPTGLERLSVLIQNHPEFAKRFQDVLLVEGHDLLTAVDTPADIRKAYQHFMSTFGHRGFRELDLRMKCWSQDASELIETLQMSLRNAATEHNTHPTCSSVDDVVNSLQCELKYGEKLFLKYLLPKTKRAVNDREVVKSILVKAVGKLKLAFWRLSELMHSQGYLPSPQLLFFLTYEELKEVLNSRSGRLVNRASRRLRIYEKQKSLKFGRFNDGYPVPLEVNRNVKSLEVEIELRGMPVSVGEVTGTARIVKSLSEVHTIQKNDIMIVHFTDVAWAPYFPLISGVVTEEGGLVSHGAVVAREYGIPCVASCQSATDLFQSGDLVCLNGATGVIRRLKRENGELGE